MSNKLISLICLFLLFLNLYNKNLTWRKALNGEHCQKFWMKSKMRMTNLVCCTHNNLYGQMTSTITKLYLTSRMHVTT